MDTSNKMLIYILVSCAVGSVVTLIASIIMQDVTTTHITIHAILIGISILVFILMKLLQLNKVNTIEHDKNLNNILKAMRQRSSLPKIKPKRKDPFHSIDEHFRIQMLDQCDNSIIDKFPSDDDVDIALRKLKNTLENEKVTTKPKVKRKPKSSLADELNSNPLMED